MLADIFRGEVQRLLLAFRLSTREVLDSTRHRFRFLYQPASAIYWMMLPSCRCPWPVLQPHTGLPTAHCQRFEPLLCPTAPDVLSLPPSLTLRPCASHTSRCIPPLHICPARLQLTHCHTPVPPPPHMFRRPTHVPPSHTGSAASRCPTLVLPPDTCLTCRSTFAPPSHHPTLVPPPPLAHTKPLHNCSASAIPRTSSCKHNNHILRCNGTHAVHTIINTGCQTAATLIHCHSRPDRFRQVGWL